MIIDNINLSIIFKHFCFSCWCRCIGSRWDDGGIWRPAVWTREYL